MLVLALDTTTRRGSMALARDGHVVAAFEGDAAITHGERLPGDLWKLLDAHGCRLADIDLFAVASGPGSFTGLRIGIATMQGLALAHDKPLAGISALDAIYDAVSAHLSVLGARDHVAVWMDAQRGQVFSAVYQNGGVVEPALVDTPADVLARWGQEHTQPSVFGGDGAIAFRDLILAALPTAHIRDPLPPLAPSIAMLAALQLQRQGPSSPDAIRPVYIRRSDAELARDRRSDANVGTTASGSRADH
jgi:tRNA threonylcarbamoyladenosine biosynthesis protein TsaB